MLLTFLPQHLLSCYIRPYQSGTANKGIWEDTQMPMYNNSSKRVMLWSGSSGRSASLASLMKPVSFHQRGLADIEEEAGSTFSKVMGGKRMTK
jgi:hypothetical protein